MDPPEKLHEKSRWATWVPIVISVLAVGLTVSQANTQRAALERQGGQLETQRQQLDVQREAVDKQGEQLAVQLQALEDAQTRWQKDGPNLTTRIDLVGEGADGVRSAGVWSGPESATPPDSGMSRFLSETDYNFYEHFYLEVSVTNIGRSPGLILGVDGELAFSEPLVDGRESALLGTVECSADASEGAVFSPCSFPLRMDAPGSMKMRVDIGDYLEHGFACAGEAPGVITVSVWIPESVAADTKQLAVSNYRQCTNPSPIVIAEPIPRVEVTASPEPTSVPSR